jgi:hypothetical protein
MTRLAALILALLAVRLGLYALAAGYLPANLCRWDCAWYLHTAQAGYDLVPSTAPGTYSQANWAFFPAFPLGIRALAAVMPYDVAGFVLANACLALFVLLAALYWRRQRGEPGSAALVAFLLAFPYGLYFSIPYTESLYAALVMAVFLLLGSRRYFAASLVLSLLVATRLTGILLWPVLAVALLRPTARRRGVLLDAALPLAIAPLGLFAFMAYLHAHMGDGLAFLHVQTGWYRRTEMPVFVLLHGLLHFDLGNLFSVKTQSVFFSMLCALAGLGLSAWLYIRRRFVEAWFLGMSVLVPLAAGPVSLQRYVLANPVFLLALFEILWRRRGFWLLVAGGAVLQLVLVHFWAGSYASLM